MHWHYRSLQNFGHWSSCVSKNGSGSRSTRTSVTRGYPKSSNASEAWLKPAGWKSVSTLWLQSSNSKAADAAWFDTPFAAVLVKDSILTVLVRGSKTLTDWLAGERLQQQQLCGLLRRR